MSAAQNINTATLPDWVQQHVRALYTAKSQDAFDRAFDAFVARDARIQLNGAPVSREQYKKTLRGEGPGRFEKGATVEFERVVYAPQAKSNQRTGAVGAFFKAELSDWFIHIIEHETHHVRSSLNVEVVEELSVQPGIGDNRRVSVISEVLTDKIHVGPEL